MTSELTNSATKRWNSGDVFSNFAENCYGYEIRTLAHLVRILLQEKFVQNY